MTSAVIYADSRDACMKAGDLIHSKVNSETSWSLHIDGLPQDCSNSSALAMELLQSCVKPSISACVITWLCTDSPLQDCWIVMLITSKHPTHSKLGIILVTESSCANSFPPNGENTLSYSRVSGFNETSSHNSIFCSIDALQCKHSVSNRCYFCRICYPVNDNWWGIDSLSMISISYQPTVIFGLIPLGQFVIEVVMIMQKKCMTYLQYHTHILK